MLAWTDVERILRGGRFYWISTTDEDGRPHLVQQWGAWVNDHLYFEGSERTHWAQNLARDARVDHHQTRIGQPLGGGCADILNRRGQVTSAAERAGDRAKVGRGDGRQVRLHVVRAHLVVLRPERLVVQHGDQ